jgi:hypothetical protein
MIGFARFDPEAFRRRLMEYSDKELIKMGKECAPGNWMIADPMTKSENATKYELCRQEWKRRHRKTEPSSDAGQSRSRIADAD